MRTLWWLALLAVLPACAGEKEAAEQKIAVDKEAGANHAVVLVYHHVAEDTPASTSVTPAQFAAHLDHLAEGGYTVWPLSRVLERLRRGDTVPRNTVALTFDDAYVSVYTNAMPMLRSRGFPFTVFVATEYLDGKYGNYLNWDQLRAIVEQGGEIGNHSINHPHLVRRAAGEDEASWRRRVREEIAGAQRRLDEEVETVPLFAYPYGEYDRDIQAIVAELGLYGIGQQSGAVGSESDFLSVPRFPMAAHYAELERFASRLKTRPLPVEVMASDSHVVKSGESPELRLRLGVGPFMAEQLACYASVGGQLEIDWIDREQRLVAVRASAPLRPGRTKYNCTVPHREGGGVYYWYSHLWMATKADGSWYVE